MNDLSRFEKICAAMANPAFYPHPAAGVARRDTHISVVFLTGSRVYKLKKPVDFGFLDFRTLDARRRFCEKEASLNARFSEGVYQGVAAVFEIAEDVFSLEGDGAPAEYAVRMKQLSPASSLEGLLRRGAAGAAEMRRLGRFLADFYARAEKNADIDRFGRPAMIGVNLEENFRQLAPFVGEPLDAERWEFTEQVCRTFLKDHESLFERRVDAGRIRDGHGDLRAEHVFFDGGVQIIDCIEFNDRFRYGDAALDLAFLYMDMAHIGHSEAARMLLEAYVEAADDPGIYALIDFYAAYRALVRAKIDCFRLADADEEEKTPVIDDIRRYMDQACRYAILFSRPTLWVFSGLPGSGKSFLATHVAAEILAPTLASDEIRKEKAPAPSENAADFGKGDYSAERRQRVYAKMLSRAHDRLKSGRSVILDATFSHARWRKEALRLARDTDANFVFADCACDPDILRARLKKRESSPGLSDARIQHLDEMTADFEPVQEIAPDMHIRIDTGQPVRTALARTMAAGHAGVCAQVRKRWAAL